jgi:L-rhamnose mutarotase
MKQYCLMLDLYDDPVLIAEYEKYHREVWPEIKQSIKDSGINHMQIYRLGPRLCMIISADENFSFEKKSAQDAANPKVQEWETLMWKYQSSLPMAKPGEKWILSKKIFEL